MDSAINKSEEVSNTHGRPDRWSSNERGNANGLKAGEETAVENWRLLKLSSHNVKLSKIGDMATKLQLPDWKNSTLWGSGSEAPGVLRFLPNCC